MPLITVSLPGPLRAKAGDRSSVTVAGNTVRDIINALEQEFPGFRFHLCYETGELRPYVNVFVNRISIRYLQGLDTPIQAEESVYILQSVAGG